MTALSASPPRMRGFNSIVGTPAPLVFAAVALLVLSVWALKGDFTSYIESGGTDSAFFERLSHSPPEQPTSLSGTEALLMRCEAVLSPAVASKYSEAERLFVALHCRDLARGSIQAMPSYAYGWYSLALFSYLSTDHQAAMEALEQAQIAGRNEQWLAERRVRLAENLFASLNGPVLAGHEADLTLLARSNRGVRSIARRYVENEGFRERITAIVETLPQADQARFLRSVRSAIATLTQDQSAS